jgi:hypothetical protein
MLTEAISGLNARLFRLAGLLALLGSLSAQPNPKPQGRGEDIVALPAISVSGDKRPWRYASLPRFEILTRASDERTYDLLLCYLRSWLVEGAVIPREWLRESPVPYTIIIDDTDPATSGPTVTTPNLTRADNFDAFGWTLMNWGHAQNDLAGRVTPLTGWIHVADDDITVLGANLHGGLPAKIAPTWLDRLDRGVPGLPGWVMAGLVGRFGLFEDGLNPVLIFVIYTSNDFTAPRDAAIFRGIRWISTAETKRLGRNLRTAEIPFIPLREFFSESSPPPEQEALWESQAGLIVRWGLLGTNRRVDHERRARFVKFVDRQRSEPVTEKMLIECFGQGYAGMEKELKAYLRKTLGMEIQFTMPNMPLGFTQKAAFGPATPDQVGRIIGDWQRIQGASLQDSQPTRAKEFLDAADRTLSRAWLRNSEWLPAPGDTAEKKNLAAIIAASQVSVAGNPDPEFLAVCGLYEYDIGEYKLARDVLEIAASLRTKRPKAYLVLAELRAREAVAKPEGKDGALSVVQATHVLQPLKAALPPASSARPWRLMVDTLARCESTPSAANLDVVIKGAAQFPRDASLQLATARLCFRSGEKERAMGVIDKALPLIGDEKVREELQSLRGSMQPR